MTQKTSMLCPKCRKLISYNETECPYCGLLYPRAIWNRFITGLFFNSDYIIPIIIIINAFFFLLSVVLDISNVEISTNPMSFLQPSNKSLFFLGASGTVAIEYYRWWSLVSASYLHGGLIHLLLNMAALKQIGALILREYGPHRMFIIYTLSGVVGFVASWIAGIQFTIGASAAVCGLVGAALYFGKSRGGAYGQAVFKQILGWVVSLYIFGILIPGINNWAHTGGLITGIAFGYQLGYKERDVVNEKRWQKISAILCLIITLAILLFVIFVGIYEILFLKK